MKWKIKFKWSGEIHLHGCHNKQQRWRCRRYIHNRICKSRVAFMKLKQIWNSRKLSLKTKIKLYKSLVMSVLLHGSETWKTNDHDNKKLDTFHFICLRIILQIRWSYVISNEELLCKTNLKRISQEVKEKRWKWIGHGWEWMRGTTAAENNMAPNSGEREEGHGLEILERGQNYSQRQMMLERYPYSLMGHWPEEDRWGEGACNKPPPQRWHWLDEG